MVERVGSANRVPGRRAWLIVAVVLLAAACSDSPSDSSDAEGTIPSAEADGPDRVTGAGDNAGAIVRPADIDPLSEYVFALCRIDPVAYLDDDDPLGAIAAAIEDLPAVTDDEQDEVAFLASSLEIAADADDIVVSPEMQQVVSLLSARCN